MKTQRRSLGSLRSRIQYNSPVILTFSLLAVGVFLLNFLSPGFTFRYFSVGALMNLTLLELFRLFSHVLGHVSWGHLFSNLTFILLLGPILEEKYGSRTLLTMILVTAFCTGLINVLFFPTGLLGASGIVFMLIILVSIVDFRQGKIPLTFLLVALIFVGTEVVNIFRFDNVSQAAHIIGGGMGAYFGFNAGRFRR